MVTRVTLFLPLWKLSSRNRVTIGITDRLRDCHNAARIGDNFAEIGNNAAGIGDNAVWIGDNAVWIGDNAAGICDISANVIPCWTPTWLETGVTLFLEDNFQRGRNRVTPVSIQDGVQHGITFTDISQIPAALSPIPTALSPIPVALLQISAELSPIPVSLSQSLMRSVMPIVAPLTKHRKTLLNIIKHL